MRIYVPVSNVRAREVTEMTSRAGRKALPPLNRTLRCPTRSATCHKECIRKKKNMLVIFERAACVIPGDSHVFERNFVDVLPRLDDILKLLVSHQSPPEQVHEVVFVIGPLILGGKTRSVGRSHQLVLQESCCATYRGNSDKRSLLSVTAIQYVHNVVPANS